MNRSRLRWTVLLLLTGVPALAAEHTKDALPTVKQKIDRKQAVLIDVREKREWDSGHIDGAILLPLSRLQGRSPDEMKKILEENVPKGRVIYTHCKVGVRALTAGNLMQNLGYDVRPLKPGYEDLLNAGFPKAK